MRGAAEMVAFLVLCLQMRSVSGRIAGSALSRLRGGELEAALFDVRCSTTICTASCWTLTMLAHTPLLAAV